MESKILVYGKSGGYATVATFLGNQWWITNKDERLEPLYDKDTFVEYDYRYISEVGELIQMRDLAGMMGCAVQCAEDDVKVELANRLKDLNMMGVKFVSSAQYMNISISVYDNKGTNRKGKYSVFCCDSDRDMMLFNVDSLDDAKAAMKIARAYMDFFLKHGVKVCATLHCTEDVLEQLDGLTTNMKIEIVDL
ncbi:MAG: hypothetical protein K6G32_11875 [Prevotella sp.]|nr:hypothetical protein [Prevotella sp.]